ncbi:MAG TPA: SDR family oxidoreductase [bacterium]|nr:SDR family oxidoreductase [bacterium]HOL49185.1 SDR family oxidoreductase [bacterium]HPO52409.1 SDR family oxidoreductase [bacterium]HXK44541.1 SDR family oxidoreductase [bacterium]
MKQTMAFNLQGKKALVTGGNSGIGFGIASALVKAGATVVIVGKNDKKNNIALCKLKKICDRCDSVRFDLVNYKKIPVFYKNLQRKYDVFDILVNCAGITVRKRADLLSIKEWEKVIAVNLTSAFVLTAQWAKSLINKNSGGCCVMVLSLMSEVARPTTCAYGASKAALKQLVKSFAVDWAKYGIRVNGISPGYIKTELTEPLYNDSKFSDWVVKRTPLGRWGIPDDIGPAVIFLCSDEASFITGQTIIIDGGFLASL